MHTYLFLFNYRVIGLKKKEAEHIKQYNTPDAVFGSQRKELLSRACMESHGAQCFARASRIHAFVSIQKSLIGRS